MLSRADVTTAEAGQCVSLALKRVRRSTVRKGMVLVHKMEAPPRGNFLLHTTGYRVIAHQRP
jgi:GTPase